MAPSHTIRASDLLSSASTVRLDFGLLKSILQLSSMMFLFFVVLFKKGHGHSGFDHQRQTLFISRIKVRPSGNPDTPADFRTLNREPETQLVRRALGPCLTSGVIPSPKTPNLEI